MPTRALGAHAASEMLDMMQAVVMSGTGRAAVVDRPVAGKTGTSQDYRDAWFIGFSAELATGVWVGNDDNTPMNKVTGGSLPTRIWHDFMALALAGKPPQPLPTPSGELPVIALTPIMPTPMTPVDAAASTVIEPANPLQPLGDNTPSPEIQNVIEKLRLLAKQRQK